MTNNRQAAAVLPDGAHFETMTDHLTAADYFLSKIEGSGHFKDRFGKVRASFHVVMQGVRTDHGFDVTEILTYSDGDVEQHLWDVKDLGNGRLEARRSDIIGKAQGMVSAKGLNWKYLLKLPNGLKLRFDDWLLPQEDGSLINRAVARKFGIHVGDMELHLTRTPL